MKPLKIKENMCWAKFHEFIIYPVALSANRRIRKNYNGPICLLNNKMGETCRIWENKDYKKLHGDWYVSINYNQMNKWKLKWIFLRIWDRIFNRI